MPTDDVNARIADKDHHFHPMTNPVTLERDGPSLVEQAHGIWVTINGKRLIDGLSGMGCVNIGYGNEAVCEAAFNAMKKLSYAHSFVGYTSSAAAALASKLSALTEGDFQRFFFASTGSDANESAIKMAYYYWKLRGQPQRRVLLARQYAYHGNTVMTASLTGIDHYHGQFGLPLKSIVEHVDTPYWYRHGKGLSVQEQSQKALASLEAKIADVGAEHIAPFFVEPVQCAGGIIIPPEGYLQQVRSICDRHDILMIADEVVTGFGKTGRMFAYQHFGVKPDMLVMAKGITSTYFPLSAVGLNHTVAQQLASADADFEHGFTNCGHPVGCAVALANIKVIEEQRLVEHVAKTLAPIIERRLAAMAQRPSVGEVRSLGILGAIDFCAAAGADFAKQTAFCEAVAACAYEHGLILRPMGPILGFVLPMITTAAEAEQCMDILDAAIRSCEQLTPAAQQTA